MLSPPPVACVCLLRASRWRVGQLERQHQLLAQRLERRGALKASNDGGAAAQGSRGAFGGGIAGGAGAGAGAGTGEHLCPHCGKRQADFEALQMHVFTACKKNPELASVIAATPSPVRPARAGKRAPGRGTAAGNALSAARRLPSSSSRTAGAPPQRPAAAPVSRAPPNRRKGGVARPAGTSKPRRPVAGAGTRHGATGARNTRTRSGGGTKARTGASTSATGNTKRIARRSPRLQGVGGSVVGSMGVSGTKVVARRSSGSRAR